MNVTNCLLVFVLPQSSVIVHLRFIHSTTHPSYESFEHGSSVYVGIISPEQSSYAVTSYCGNSSPHSSTISSKGGGSLVNDGFLLSTTTNVHTNPSVVLPQTSDTSNVTVKIEEHPSESAVVSTTVNVKSSTAVQLSSKQEDKPPRELIGNPATYHSEFTLISFPSGNENSASSGQAAPSLV